MLQDTKRDLVSQARRLTKPYEVYSIDELANAYCEAADTKNETLKDIYISALVLRFWSKIDKMFRSNTVAPTLEREDFFWWLYEAIEYACKYRGWKDTAKNLNAEQCINKCIETIKLQKYYNLRLDKYKTVNCCVSLETPLGGQDSGSENMTLEDTLQAEDSIADYLAEHNAVSLIQSYINSNKIIEAVLLDNIAFNDVQKNFKKIIKVESEEGKITKYTEHSSKFWSFKLIQLVSKLPDTYKEYFLTRYKISEEKLNAVLEAISKANNQRLYKYTRDCLSELRATYTL